MDSVDESKNSEELELNLARLKSRMCLCVAKIESKTGSKLTPVYYPIPSKLLQFRGFRNLPNKQFCGVTCLYSIALKLLAEDKHKFPIPDCMDDQNKFDLCIDYVNRTMTSQAGNKYLLIVKLESF